MDKPLAAFYAFVFILIWVFDALFGQARAAALVVPGQMTPNDLAWLAEATGTTVSGSLDALLSKPVNGTLTTAKGAKIPLPANWSAAIPRATVAQAAGKLLARATPVGLAGLALYQLLHSSIGLNADGSQTVQADDYTYTQSPFGIFSCPTQSFGPGTTASVGSAYLSWLQSCHPGYNDTVAGNVVSQGVYHVKLTLGSQNTGEFNVSFAPVSGSTTTRVPTEADLGTAIQNSPAPTAGIADGVIKDAKTANIDFSSLDFLKPVQPTTVSAQPVVGPEEVIDVATSGTKTTTTKVQTTATPKVTGTTVGDQALQWETADKATKTTTDSATGVTTTETTTTSYGTSTTQQQPDYGKFAGTGPGDGYADGLTFINSKLCGGNCAAAFSCATGNCTVAERVNVLKTKYSVSPMSSGTCPALDMDLSGQGYGTHHTTEHCDLAETVRGVVATIMTLLTAAAVISIILTA
ncbi:hypothetical protein [Methylomonas sp. UP202]|uniref:hypothetical protein n=1 Tax=Methylomonas sp. UP202 TaxID=3040943 RepID=UPI00247A3837|nr:hypothetical protein [Methylomonas sp. UP202]WGS84973.1 hypothetical protein QC632_18240 [Methylomonas sp. UP202]